MRRRRVLYILSSFPEWSQSYIHTEIEALSSHFDIFVLARKQAHFPCKTGYPFRVLAKEIEIHQVIMEWRPSVLHGHYLSQYDLCLRLAEIHKIPFTIRTHSFDVLGATPERLQDSPWLRAVLGFPFAQEKLNALGIPGTKLRPTFPVLGYSKFLNKGPNKRGVLNLGACLPKKNFEEYLHLAGMMPKLKFSLFPLGYGTSALQKRNLELGSPVSIHNPVQHDKMPEIYKNYDWLVYTASTEENTVGWPVAIAEAQASGLGVCVPRIRRDIEDYLEGSGVIYRSIFELPEILKHPPSEKMREMGFKNALRSDVNSQIALLTSIWSESGQAQRLEQGV